jgi:hypothetical protein
MDLEEVGPREQEPNVSTLERGSNLLLGYISLFKYKAYDTKLVGLEVCAAGSVRWTSWENLKPAVQLTCNKGEIV